MPRDKQQPVKRLREVVEEPELSAVARTWLGLVAVVEGLEQPLHR